MITQEEIERACDWLRNHASVAAKARAERLYMESWVKVVLAKQMKQFADLPVAAQEREARTSEPYREALLAYRESIEIDEKHRFLRDAAEAKIEAFRTQEATRRIEAKGAP